MTADVVNLRRARKAKARGEAAEVAAANRHQFGRSRAETELLAARSTLTERRLDGHRLESHRPDDAAPTASGPYVGPDAD